MPPNEGRNNWCHSRLQDFDFETFRDFFRLRDQKTSGAMAPVAPPSLALLNIWVGSVEIIQKIFFRLGPLGFLYQANEMVPGNVGLRDQAMALKWVNANIEYFGGNPDSVTLFGESAGSLSVALQLLSPLSNGLFQRAVMQSGEALNHVWSPISQKQALQFENLLAKELNCDLEDIHKKLKCMQEKSVEDILGKYTDDEKSVKYL